MRDQVFNIAEAKTHFSRLIERVERGEHITIARNNHPVAVLSPAQVSSDVLISKMREVRESIRKRNRGRSIRKRGESWRDLIDSGRRI